MFSQSTRKRPFIAVALLLFSSCSFPRTSATLDIDPVPPPEEYSKKHGEKSSTADLHSNTPVNEAGTAVDDMKGTALGPGGEESTDETSGLSNIAEDGNSINTDTDTKAKMTAAEFQDQEHEHGHGHWGTPLTSTTTPDLTQLHNNANNYASSNNNNHTLFIPKSKLNENDNGASKTTIKATMASSSTKTQGHHQQNYEPPESFTLSAQITTPKSRSTSSFIPHNDIPSIPFMECNSVGTTTPAISTSSISFRSFPKSAHPTSNNFVSNTRGFIIPLSKVEIKTSDGDERIFDAGTVIWVDDGGEYQMSSADVAKDLSVIIVDVPKKKHHHHHHYHKGVDKSTSKSTVTSASTFTSLPGNSSSLNGKIRPSTTAVTSATDLFGLPQTASMLTCNDDSEDDEGVWNSLRTNFGTISARRVLLSSLGLSLSSMMTYFWIKVAPLQLAVGIGGLCMIGGGTLAVVMGGEHLCDEIGASLENLERERDRERLQQESKENDNQQANDVSGNDLDTDVEMDGVKVAESVETE